MTNTTWQFVVLAGTVYVFFSQSEYLLVTELYTLTQQTKLAETISSPSINCGVTVMALLFAFEIVAVMLILSPITILGGSQKFTSKALPVEIQSYPYPQPEVLYELALILNLPDKSLVKNLIWALPFVNLMLLAQQRVSA